jgi:cytochrome P450
MNKLTKLDNFIHEVFRMHPIVVQVINCECMEDTCIGGYDIEKGNIALCCCRMRKQLYIRAGSLVQVDLYSINFNQELWGPEPVDEFHPERHSRQRHPLANMTFGAEPRQCLGMRFALSKFCFSWSIFRSLLYASGNQIVFDSINQGILHQTSSRKTLQTQHT